MVNSSDVFVIVAFLTAVVLICTSWHPHGATAADMPCYHVSGHTGISGVDLTVCKTR